MKRFLIELLGTAPTTAELLKLSVGAPLSFVGALITSDVSASLLLLGCSLAFGIDAGISIGRRIKE